MADIIELKPKFVGIVRTNRALRCARKYHPPDLVCLFKPQRSKIMGSLGSIPIKAHPHFPMLTWTPLTKGTGISLLETALAEAELSEPRSQAFSRQLYIHALAYLLQALPSDLSNAEIVCIDNALPHGLQRRTRVSPSSSRTYQQPPSLLHRFLAATIIQFFILGQLVLPYIRCFLHTAYRYERTHQISEKVVMTSVNTGERIAKLWWDILQGLSKIPDKKLVAMLASILLCWLQGISGGIHEGIGEGMSIIGVTKADLI